jgi:GNAT superfamily N-acetyltransferase
VLELREVTVDQLSVRLPEVIDRVAAQRAAARFLPLEEARRRVEDQAERMKDDGALLDVVEGDDRVGVVWWGRQGPESTVVDLVLDDPAHAAALLPLLVARARAEGTSRIGIGIGVGPGSASRTALAALPGFVARATNMALRLDGELPDTGGVELRPMTGEEFTAFQARLVDGYAADIAVASGLTAEAARARSEKEFEGLIPDGQDSPGMLFFTAWHDGRPVGRLWLFTSEPMVFVYDVEVNEEERRKGYGAAIMNAGARWSRDQGHPAIGLNVFAHNPGARALYDKLGYEVTVDYRTLDVGDA